MYEVKKDNYDTMVIALSELTENMLIFNAYGQNYLIDWHLSGDMVWMKTERGLNGCNSKFPCFTCEIPRTEFFKDNNEALVISDLKHKIKNG